MSTTLRNSRLIENCSTSISYDAQVQAASQAFDFQMYQIIDETGQVIMIPSIMDIEDSNLIDILAWQFHVDFYDHTRDLEFRKNLVQMSIQWHITKGTPHLVQWVLDTYSPGGASITEWFEYYVPFPPGLSPTSHLRLTTRGSSLLRLSHHLPHHGMTDTGSASTSTTASSCPRTKNKSSC